MPAYVISLIIISNFVYGESALPIIKTLVHPKMKILRELHSYRLILLSTNISTMNHDFYRYILLQSPAVSLDLRRITINEEKRILTLPLLKNAISSTVYVIFETEGEDGIDLKSIKYTLDIITQWSVVSPRPKLLIVYQTFQQILVKNLQSVLTYAWSLEFIDCTILVTTSRNTSFIFTYNPFTKQLIEDSSIVKLFHDKLCNMYGYPIKIPSIELPPYIYVKRNYEGKVVDMTGMSYQYCRILSETLNFTLKIIPGLENSVMLGNFTILFEKLHSKEVDMLALPCNVASIMYDFKDKLVIGKLFMDTNYVILVPIEPLVKVDIPIDVIISIPLLFFIICAYQICKMLFRFPSEHWHRIKIFQILLGYNVSRSPPKTVVEKVIYMSLVILSLKFSIVTLTKIMDIKIVKGEVDYNCLDDIAQSDLPIYTLDFIIEHVYKNTEDTILLKMKSKTYDVINMFQCVNEMVVNKSCMCIIPHSAGAYVTKKYVKADGTPITKVARPILYNDMAAFSYSKMSPYVKKFDGIIQRIVESGIAYSWSGAQTYTIKSEDFKSRKPLNENIFLQQLYTLLLAGYSLASIVFVIEIVRTRCKMQKQRDIAHR